ncbi:excitatory amino acid transporter 1-like isoform X1 [Belonocnema kinseyi]|uniref:excitatory amino acid transporter 1-like isoform X1 n=1 Tax=Belonocnema kinseyi TaxID=2817044 RepID=UPI00143D6C0B|nr:excitatory amino acid transporter 1-like isoform X1 [Belonocnema kinseyi]XP_033214649.1 excitatory amino acid transporter 1-like isoform X1 [Belonocnema kinseyi]
MEVATELSPLSGVDGPNRKDERKSYYPEEPSRLPRTRKEKMATCLRHNALTLLTVFGVVGGVVLGIGLRASRESWSQREQMYVNYAGELFLRMLKGLILPLIMSSLISAIGSLDLSLSGKIGSRAVIYYFVTTISAVILGIILVISIRPGAGDIKFENITESKEQRNVTTPDTLLDLIRNMFPPNLVEACISQYRTGIYYDSDPRKNQSSIDKFTWTIRDESASGTNILGLVVFSAILGITLGKMGEPGKPLLYFFEALSSAMMIITNWVVWLSPLGVLFLVAARIIEIKSIEQTVKQLGMYFMTVLIGLCIHGFLILPAIFFLLTKRNPLSYISNMAQALVTAFGTSSSSATLPVAIGCLEDRNGIDPRVTRFVMPIGATINMDGTALYEAVAAIFISQTLKQELSLGQIVAVSITATAASIGAAGIPQAGLVTMVMVLDTVGIDAKNVATILAVDWLLDRCRTTVNVLGDSLGAGIVHHLSRNELSALPRVDKMTSDHHATSI